MMKRLLICLMGAVWPTLPARAEGLAKSDADDVQAVIFFGETRPVLIHIHARVDGKPLPAVWDKFVFGLFKSLDTDKDGVLSPSELEKLPGVLALFGVNLSGNENAPKLQKNGGKATFEQLRDYLRRVGAGPFRVEGAEPGRPRGPRFMNGPTADALNQAFFNLLDTNKDGKLSREELAEAASILMTRDQNDDEMIEPFELARPAPFDEREVFVAPYDREQIVVPTFRAVYPADRQSELARQLLVRYGRYDKKKDYSPPRRLTAKQIGLDEATFRQLDADENGELDIEELARFAERPPDVELIVRFGKRDAKELPLEIAVGKEQALAAILKLTKDGAVLLDLGLTQVEAQARAENTLQAVRERFQALFKEADQDNNGYLDEKEASRSPVFSALFKALDADGDGKVYEKELMAYVDEQLGVMAATMTFRFSDESKGFFDLLDTDGDGRLSVREMRNAVNLIALLDRDGDGAISKAEIPRRRQVTLEQGAGGASILSPPAPAKFVGGRPKRMTDLKGPLWFQKMDLNRDGDVSRREFLGTNEQFNKIDTDGDGLISLEEASAYEKKKRP
jgi:Ca2+-binding EF-hand superfamily protein